MRREDAKALITATADVAEEKVIEARRRLASALERGKEAWGNMEAKAVESAKATDEVIRTHPYESLAIALGVGVLLGGGVDMAVAVDFANRAGGVVVGKLGTAVVTPEERPAAASITNVPRSLASAIG